MTYDLKQTTLDSGITVVTDRAPHFNSAAIQATFKVGSMYESDAQSGIAHLLEHLVFRGTTTRTGDEIQQAFQEIGGEINAVTDEDTTAFRATVLHEEVATALDIIGDMVSRPTLSAEHIKLEQQIVEQENCNGCWNCTMRETFLDAAYPGHGVARPIIGLEKTVNALTQDDLIAFHKAAYTTGALVIAVAGNVDHDMVVAQVSEAFSDLTEGPGMAAEKLVFEPGEAHLSSGSEQGVIRIGFPEANERTRAARAREVWIDIIAGHGYSLLMRELREEHGLVYGVYGGTWGIGDREIHQFEARGDTDKMDEITQRIASVMHTAAKTIDPRELEGAKRRVKTSRLMGLDGVTNRCAMLAHNTLYYGSVGNPEESLADYMDLSVEEVAEAGRHILSQSPVILGYGPTRTMPRLSDVRERFSLAKGDASPKRRGFFRLVG